MGDAASPRLTPVRWRVLVLLAAGANDREIATVLSSTPNAVSNHLRHIYRLLPLGNATNRRAAAVFVN